MIKAPQSFMEQVLWPEVKELNAALIAYLSEITEKGMRREEVHKETGEAEEVDEPKQSRAMTKAWHALVFCLAVGVLGHRCRHPHTRRHHRRRLRHRRRHREWLGHRLLTTFGRLRRRRGLPPDGNGLGYEGPVISKCRGIGAPSAETD